MIMRNTFIRITCIVILAFSMVGCGDLKVDNVTSKNDLITKTYSIDKIQNMKQKVESGFMDFKQFKKEFKIQCMRKTHQGYYVVLLQDDGKDVFVFMNNEFNLHNVMIKDKFITREEFEQFLLSEPTVLEVMLFDVGTILLPVSAVNMTAHHVKGGVLLVTYEKQVPPVQEYEVPKVKSVEFYQDEDIINNDDDFIRLVVPYILEIDKEHKE